MEAELQQLKAQIAKKENQLQEMTLLYLDHQSRQDQNGEQQKSTRYMQASALVNEYTTSIRSSQYHMEQLVTSLNQAHLIRSKYVEERNSILTEFAQMCK